ncbi:hypothetical protein TNCV_3750441 [Trichonephila clavipes]|nr:hypothetical protein TNCV_3750441 [Trichonephila clavipes]
MHLGCTTTNCYALCRPYAEWVSGLGKPPKWFQVRLEKNRLCRLSRRQHSRTLDGNENEPRDSNCASATPEWFLCLYLKEGEVGKLRQRARCGDFVSAESGWDECHSGPF